MFKFNFEESNTRTLDDQEQPITRSPCMKVSLADVRKHSKKDCKEEFLRVDSIILRHFPYSEIREEAFNQSKEINKAETTHSDLVPGVYEGGLKIWECTHTLAQHLVSSCQIDWCGKRVLDLGCGAGILGIIALRQGAIVTFQDYNKDVLELLTGQNVLLNKRDVIDDNVKFYAGDWSFFCDHLREVGEKFDVILTSETVYNPNNYQVLHDVIDKLLAPDGVCYLAGKSVYFGVGGSMFAFRQFVEKRGVLSVESCFSTNIGVTQEVFKVVHSVPDNGNT